jgi:hypothetical protein
VPKVKPDYKELARASCAEQGLTLAVEDPGLVASLRRLLDHSAKRVQACSKKR